MRNKKGFTLAELLIVVAIIAVLVGISIPVFTSQLEKSREAKDLANVRAKYAELMVYVVAGDVPSVESDIVCEGSGSSRVFKASVELSQKQQGWSMTLPINVGGVEYNGTDNPQWLNEPVDGSTCLILYAASTNTVTFNWNGSKIYSDSAEVLTSKTQTQESAKKYLAEINNLFDNKYPDKDVRLNYINNTLNNNSDAQNAFTLSDGTKAYYKSSADKIDTLEKAGTGNGSSWINFTFDENGEIKVFNYVDNNYSYSTTNASDERTSWIGTAVFK